MNSELWYKVVKATKGVRRKNSFVQHWLDGWKGEDIINGCADELNVLGFDDLADLVMSGNR